MKKNTRVLAAVGVVAGVLIGCATEDAGSVGLVDVDGVEPQAEMSYVGWTVNALKPSSYPTGGGARAAVTLTNVSGLPTERAGACLVKRWVNPSTGLPVACNALYGGPNNTTTHPVPNGSTECVGAGAPVYPGWFNYCLNVNNTGQGYCYVREGANTDPRRCVGSPQNGGNPIAPGTYYTDWTGIEVGAQYMTLGCLRNCGGENNGTSSSSASLGSAPCTLCGSYCCPKTKDIY